MTSHRLPTRRRRFRETIAGKITLRMVLVAAVPILALGALTIGSLWALANRADQQLEAGGTELTLDTIGAERADDSQLVLRAMDAYIDERLSDTIDWSRAQPLIEATGAEYPELEEITDWPTSLIDSRYDVDYRLDRSGRSNRWLRTQLGNQNIYTQALVTDANGFTVGAAEPSDDFTHADEPWWQQAWSEGAFLDRVEVDELTGHLSMTLAVRIDDPTTNQPLGVIQAVLDASALQPFADELADEERNIEVTVLGSSGRLLAETSSDHEPGRLTTTNPFDDEQAAAYAGLRDASEVAGSLVLEDTVGGYARSSGLRAVPRLGIEITSPAWVVLVEQPSDDAFEPVQGLEMLSSDIASTARTLTLIIAVLALAALTLAYLVARLLANRIAQPINQLCYEANQLADRELPDFVESLRAPGMVGEVPSVRPVRVDAEGEVGELATAFNSVRSTAVELAAGQAIGRVKDISSMLLNLGRRNQQLVGRQLRFIDDLERSESDPDTLRSLFILDQMATRMRRNAENLIVLAGDDSPRRVNHPRPIEEVIRAATGEVEDYARVRMVAIDATLVQPTVVNDLTHLLAELIENATNFSPPQELIEIVGVGADDGSYTLSIVDSGVGMSREQLDEANARLDQATFTEEASSTFLGLFVVGRLADRHGIDARLVESTTTGITAKVTLPPSCLAEIPTPVGEVTGSRLTAPEPLANASAWPAPAVSHRASKSSSRFRPPAPRPMTATVETEPVVATSPPAERAEVAAAAEPAELPTAAPEADEEDLAGDVEDTTGLPIPPFRARESKRPATAPPPDDRGANATPDEAGQDQTFQVRRRVRHHAVAAADEVLEPIAPDIPTDDGVATERAAEVREKLNRFANGVQAAKSRQPGSPGALATADDPAVEPDDTERHLLFRRRRRTNGNGGPSSP